MMTIENIERTYQQLDERTAPEVAKIQKEMTERLASVYHQFTEDEHFLVFSASVAIFIINILNSYGITNPEDFMGDLTETVKYLFPKIIANSTTMSYQNGIKVAEGRKQ